MKVDTGLESVIEKQKKAAEDNTLATRVTNALLLAQAMKLNITEPLDRAKVLRHLKSVEHAVSSDSDE